MALTLELPSELEEQILGEAAQAGMDPTAFVLQRLSTVPSGSLVSSLSDSALLQRINAGMTESFWSRYDDLSHKREAETLSEEERAELIGLTDRLEEQSAERLIWLSELTTRRGISPGDLLDTLGIRPHTIS